MRGLGVAPGSALWECSLGGHLCAAAIASEERIDALVLWDPCADGRAYRREQVRLCNAAIGVVAASDGFVETPGFRYDAATALAVHPKLKMADVSGQLTSKTMVLTRPGRDADRRLVAHLVPPDVEWGEASGQDGMLVGVSVPEEAIRRVADWIDRAADGQAVKVLTPTTNETRVEAPNAPTIVERAGLLGPYVFGVTTELPDHRPTITVVFFNTGGVYHIGPGRLWVDLAREWARRGVRCVRLDLSGIGDSFARPGQRTLVNMPSAAFDDSGSAARVIARTLSPDDPSKLIMVGVCAGAYHAMEAGILLGLEGVCAINPSKGNADPQGLASDADTHRRAAVPDSRLIRTIRSTTALTKILRPIKRRAPRSFWHLLDKLGIQKNPATPFENLAERCS